ncbi:hypothetical protein DPMN_000350 [Dreissena polymorpha]|uniref:Uncharacterized protein n=1 Tax=Dreissena polymorpha TaxID=45954 RepID=A0A9D4MHZ4_DREPO|nr:hypothetical protein DPMN_000350 [Dreissena polymorpha]
MKNYGESSCQLKKTSFRDVGGGCVTPFASLHPIRQGNILHGTPKGKRKRERHRNPLRRDLNADAKQMDQTLGQQELFA